MCSSRTPTRSRSVSLSSSIALLGFTVPTATTRRVEKDGHNNEIFWKIRRNKHRNKFILSLFWCAHNALDSIHLCLNLIFLVRCVLDGFSLSYFWLLCLMMMWVALISYMSVTNTNFTFKMSEKAKEKKIKYPNEWRKKMVIRKICSHLFYKLWLESVYL